MPRNRRTGVAVVIAGAALPEQSAITINTIARIAAMGRAYITRLIALPSAPVPASTGIPFRVYESKPDKRLPR